MPLHLLGQKSWNVYSTQNQERVRRDEAAARLKEEEDERRMQEADAERRILELKRRRQLITGPPEEHPSQRQVSSNDGGTRETAMQREFGDEHGHHYDDDRHQRSMMDRDTRISVPDLVPSIVPAEHGAPVDRLMHEGLVGADGHLNLFKDEEDKFGRKKKRLSARDRNEEYEKEKREKDAKIEAQFTSRLDKPAEELRPWYTALNKVGEKQEKKSAKQLDWEKHKDEKAKEWNDPMVIIRQGVRELKEVEDDRKLVERERMTDLDKLRMEDRELEEFSLDGTSTGGQNSKSRDKYRHSDRRDERNKNRKRSLSRNRSRGRSRSRDRDRNRSRESRHRKKEEGRHSHRHRRRQSRTRSRTPRRPEKDDNMIKKLRLERDRRELLERQKAEAVVSKIREDASSGYKVATGGRYSAQFASSS